MLREEVEQYTNLTGEDGWHVPIMKVGAYLDGYNKGLEVLDKIRAEIESITPKAHIRTRKQSIDTELMIPLNRVLKVLDKYKTEMESEG